MGKSCDSFPLVSHLFLAVLALGFRSEDEKSGKSNALVR